MHQLPERVHWINVVVGMLDTSFHLTDEEQFGVTDVMRHLLARLRIPERGLPENLPIPLAQEVQSNLYSLHLEAPRESGIVRPVRAATSHDNVTSLEAWRLSFENMFTTAYPDLAVEERLLLRKALTDLLMAIGVPNRAASTFPNSVLAAHRELHDEV